jgi:predicted kinase
MRKSGLIVITGLPGTGKTTLARLLARRYAIALIAKDTIKEPLLDVLGCDRAQSRTLSNVSFAVMFAIARQLLASRCDAILEGNFRVGEHEVPLRAALAEELASVVQVLCRVAETRRRARMAARAGDSTRHPGHRDAGQMEPSPECDAFLDLPGERMVFDGGDDAVSAESELVAKLDRWRAVP